MLFLFHDSPLSRTGRWSLFAKPVLYNYYSFIYAGFWAW